MAKTEGGFAIQQAEAPATAKLEPGTDAYRRHTPFADKLLALYERVGYMQKGGKNSHFKYSFLQESAVKQRVNAACVELGIIILDCGVEIVDQRSTGGQGVLEGVPHDKPSPGPAKECVCRVTVTLADAFPKEGAHTGVRLQGLGGGTDSSDKAPMKAEVSAWKYALMNGLAIATGDDPEADATVDQNSDAEELLEQLARVKDAETLLALKLDVRSLEGTPAFDALKAAWSEANARLKAATNG